MIHAPEAFLQQRAHGGPTIGDIDSDILKVVQLSYCECLLEWAGVHINAIFQAPEHPWSLGRLSLLWVMRLGIYGRMSHFSFHLLSYY